MKVLITGSKGQLGRELQNTAPRDHEIFAYDIDELDITNESVVKDCLLSLKPELVINAAAYTTVDNAEDDKNTVFAVNADGPRNISSACNLVNARLIHLSTDFVFNGENCRPYRTSAAPAPINVYGASKLEGERNAISFNSGNTAVVRTAWVYSRYGKNFVKTMLGLIEEREEIGVVADQVGTPTWARTLAKAIWEMGNRSELSGIYHWTDAGVASWYDFAVAIHDEALQIGLLKKHVSIIPLRTEEYPLAARRPSYTVLEKSDTWKALGLTPPHWRLSLRAMLREMADLKKEISDE